MPGQATPSDRTRSVRTATTGEEVEVVRSSRRRRTVSAYREGDRTILLVPARMSAADEQRWVETMVARLAAKDTRRRPSDAGLARRAAVLSARHLDGRARPDSVRWVSNMRTRWGSATPADRSIRLSDRLQGMPDWVVDYVLVHELAHLLVADHSPRFWALVAGHPRAELARGYLLGVVNAPAVDPDAADNDLDEPDPDEPDPDEPDLDLDDHDLDDHDRLGHIDPRYPPRAAERAPGPGGVTAVTPAERVTPRRSTSAPPPPPPSTPNAVR